ncbi:MAG TPA: alpha-ketoacid dehydrogenase subunit beta [Thermoanaerobaculia bacterium]|jgi:pyruvate dehydrogenase E1 component beta subunit|nr:alpha-ketoacid dehydrogenase subunit beta [Thermoanaerobaculia bacterium]
MSEKSYRDAIREAMMEEMDRDPNVLIMGEDIGVYEGTFRITAGMLKKYGPKRIIDTPIAEAGMIGTAVGMAMLGLRPIVEMMTINFSIVAADQIVNHAAKVRYFSGGQVDVPVIVRGPQGAGVQLSAQHSQSLESFYGHFPGMHVVAPATPADAKGLLKTAIRGKDPVLFLESAALYGMKGEVPDDPDFTVPFGKSRVAREGRDVTIVSYSRMLQLSLVVAEQLSKDEGIECEVIDLRSLRPLDMDPVFASVSKTHRAIVVQEQWKPYGAAAEISASIMENMFDELDAPVARVTGEDVPMPYARNLELLATPHEPEIIRAVKKVMYANG